MELADGRVFLHAGDCLEVLASLPENSIDAVVTDPPYHFTSIVKRFGFPDAAPAQFGSDGAFARASRGFMGKEWDGGDIAFRPDTWALIWRVLKPGGHMVAFGAPKNYHRLACAIEDAGFEIRDSLMWVFGAGFPKSMDVSKAIDKAAGAERTERLGPKPGHEEFASRETKGHLQTENHNDGWKRPWKEREDVDNYHYQFAPATDAAKQWAGWGTALKPAYEPIVLARKPLSEKTVAANVLRWGTGALNINATRVETDDVVTNHSRGSASAVSKGIYGDSAAQETHQTDGQKLGRWPANLCHDGSQQVLDLFPHTKSGFLNQASVKAADRIYGGGFGNGKTNPRIFQPNEGSAARFFYSAKASKADRAGSKHPTVKPVALMQWLVRMVTPPGGTVLDPFAGSGTTAQAAVNEGFQAVLIEREEEYQSDIRNRLSA